MVIASNDEKPATGSGQGRGKNVSVRIVIDQQKCVGAGSCVIAAPDLFDQREEDGVVILLNSDPSDSRVAAAREAELVCPAKAIRIEDGGA